MIFEKPVIVTVIPVRYDVWFSDNHIPRKVDKSRVTSLHLFTLECGRNAFFYANQVLSSFYVAL